MIFVVIVFLTPNVILIGELHLTPLKSIVQLRPTLRHIEIGDTIAANKPSGAQSDGDTTATESEEEEAKPVTVSDNDTCTCSSENMSLSDFVYIVH